MSINCLKHNINNIFFLFAAPRRTRRFITSSPEIQTSTYPPLITTNIPIISPRNNMPEKKETTIFLDLPLEAKLFEDGKLRLRCIAELFQLYRAHAETIIDEGPRLAPILATRESGCSKYITVTMKCIGLFLIIQPKWNIFTNFLNTVNHIFSIQNRVLFKT